MTRQPPTPATPRTGTRATASPGGSGAVTPTAHSSTRRPASHPAVPSTSAAVRGADAIWLASQGWRTTGLDVSIVALERARANGAKAGVDVEWLHAGLLDADLDPGSFQLVSAQYPALGRTADRAAERLLTSLVAPGGTLLFIHHDVSGSPHGHHGDFGGVVMPQHVLRVLDDGWTILTNQTRQRRVSGGAEALHTRDIVLRAQRTR